MLTPRPSSDQQNQNFQELSICTFSKHYTSPPSSPTNDPDDGLGLGQLALATGEEDLGSKDDVFLLWSLRDAEDRRLPEHRDRWNGHHVIPDPCTWLCNL